VRRGAAGFGYIECGAPGRGQIAQSFFIVRYSLRLGPRGLNSREWE
jgi:hypothetical protein